MPEFRDAGGAEALFDHLNSLPGQAGYVSKHYCPADDEHPDYDSERMFFTQQNGRRLDAMREEVERMRAEEQVSEAEHAILVAALVFGASYCSNTSGVFKGFHRGWGGATRTAWYRIRAPIQLRPPVLFDNGLRNEAVQMDARLAAAQFSCDIAYLDPPYNQHQYGANYHLLNTIALSLGQAGDTSPVYAGGKGHQGRHPHGLAHGEEQRILPPEPGAGGTCEGDGGSKGKVGAGELQHRWADSAGASCGHARFIRTAILGASALQALPGLQPETLTAPAHTRVCARGGEGGAGGYANARRDTENMRDGFVSPANAV